MVMRILKWLGMAIVALGVIAAGLYATRSNPMGPIAGRALTGELVTTPVSDWSFSDEQMLIAVESRPAAPHSVTTICIALDGKLYVPARDAAKKGWPHYAVSDPRVRVKIGDKIYPGRATRVTDEGLRGRLIAAGEKKYERELGGGVPPEGVWVFEIESRPADG